MEMFNITENCEQLGHRDILFSFFMLPTLQFLFSITLYFPSSNFLHFHYISDCFSTRYLWMFETEIYNR